MEGAQVKRRIRRNQFPITQFPLEVAVGSFCFKAKFKVRNNPLQRIEGSLDGEITDTRLVDLFASKEKRLRECLYPLLKKNLRLLMQIRFRLLSAIFSVETRNFGKV
jgi:hypothetical protein